MPSNNVRGAYGWALTRSFLGAAPAWYKAAIVGFLVVNPVIFFSFGPFIAGWILLIEFIFTLAMALKCYPLGPGGLLALEAIAIGMATPDAVYNELVHNIPVILLLMFMVAGVFFLQELLMFLFTHIFLGVRSKIGLSLIFTFVAALLSAFLDALTVTAVIIAVVGGLYAVYHKAASCARDDEDHDRRDDAGIHELSRADLDQFRSYLRNLMMHAVVGTALGGMTTLVGEPQNLLLAHAAGWHFTEFFLRVAPVSIPVLIGGLLTCVLLERVAWFGYGTKLPEGVRQVLEDYEGEQRRKRGASANLKLAIQGVIAVLLVAALAFHVAEIGLIGLALLVVATALTGIVEENRIGHAFTEALPFTALLVVFFAVIAVIDEHQLFHPIMNWVFSFRDGTRLGMVYAANGLLSVISDNVFVATVYLKEVKAAVTAGAVSPTEFQQLIVAINAGTNIPSVATPNGQAAFLFLLTSALAPLIRLSYGRMVWMALPYAVILSLVGLLSVVFLL
ncbi:MAG TPA: sodium/proton antiporter NhaB [Gammaproteobacteria bacterium]|nr:sodium/proton antiporter NhaB [Gammaproteobacteria bacterium]